MKQAKILLATVLVASAEPIGTVLAADGAPQAKLLFADRVVAGFQGGQDRVAVIVNLVPPARALQATDWNAPHSLQTLHAANRAAQEEVLKTLAGDEHHLRFRFDNQAGFSCDVTPGALEKLLHNPQVESIEPVQELEAHLAQGIPLMNALASRSTYTGAGVAIAICDTGIDYNHPRLGGGGFPNSKVIGGYDFGDGDANPLPNGQAHGTCCAGIASGDLGTVGDYIGGVAPAAKLYACKISQGTTGSAQTDAMVAAWDWCVTHRNDNAANPIMIISTSFGGGRHFSTCDGTVPAMTTAAHNAVAAGITVLASSGNNGYCDSMGWPACISSVISVGAVYDANFGTYLPCVAAESCAPKTGSSGCPTGYLATDYTQADRVTSYANVASFLTVFAPANRCYTLDISGLNGDSTGDYCASFGGTSAACPYVAGAVACLQHAAKTLRGAYLTPAEVRSRLTASGDLVTDSKVAITKPRVNLGRAIANLSPTIPNDQCGGAIALSNGGCAAVDTANATSTGDPLPTCGSAVGKGVWYKVTPTANATVTVSTCGSDFDTVLAVYSGGCGALTQMACNDDNGPACATTRASVSFPAVVGTPYYILAGGYSGASGFLQIAAQWPVAVPPTITVHPVRQSVPAGANATFSVAATGTAPLAYAWRLNGNPIAGATANTYTLNNVQFAHQGSRFSCVVTNSAGSATSQEAVLTVTTNSAGQSLWAVSATASSQYSSANWSAAQAVGAPNTTRCGDLGTAWAPLSSGSDPEWLEVGFNPPRPAAALQVHETYNAGFIYRVDLVDANNSYHTVWTGTDTTPCPGWFTLTFPRTSYPVKAARIHTQKPGWEEIDAVGLLDLMWATSAIASSEYSTNHWSAAQATGAPNTADCGDIVTAWAPRGSGSDPEWLEVRFALPLPAVGLQVHETYHSGSIYRVDLVDTSNLHHTVWTGTDTTPCPGWFTLTFPGTSYLVQGVRIYTRIAGWEEIDAAGLLVAATDLPFFGSWQSLGQGQFRFTLAGVPGGSLRIEASTNLVDWSALTNLVNPTGTVTFTDHAPGATRRFYRAVAAP